MKAKQFLANDKYSNNLLNCTTVLLKASTTSMSDREDFIQMFRSVCIEAKNEVVQVRLFPKANY